MYNLWHSQVPIGETTASVFRLPSSVFPINDRFRISLEKNTGKQIVFIDLGFHRFRFSFYGFIKLGKMKTLKHLHSLLKHRDHNRTIN